MAVQRALLLIADIAGYTRFMTVHRVNLAHAQDVIAQLLESVIDGARKPMTLSKLEGDAALFYAPLPEESIASVPEMVVAMRRSFLERRRQMEIDVVCTCDGCVQVGQLTLKFVVHYGEVAIQKVKQYRELAGVDVILVHRMLKNTVPIPEYVLMTDAVADRISSLKESAVPLPQEFEGFDETRTYYLPVSHFDSMIPAPRPSFFRRWKEWAMRNVRSLPFFLGLKKPCEGFLVLDTIVGNAPPSGAMHALARDSSPPPTKR
jgi:class 3 adenylate cyclase